MCWSKDASPSAEEGKNGDRGPQCIAGPRALVSPAVKLGHSGQTAAPLQDSKSVEQTLDDFQQCSLTVICGHQEGVWSRVPRHSAVFKRPIRLVILKLPVEPKEMHSCREEGEGREQMRDNSCTSWTLKSQKWAAFFFCLDTIVTLVSLVRSLLYLLISICTLALF